MVPKVNKFFLLIFLVLLQSCSGGTIGNFLESSFNNIEEPKLKEETKSNLMNTVVISPKEKEKIVNIQESKIKEEIKSNSKNKKFIKPVGKLEYEKITKTNISNKKIKYQPQSYKIIFILKDVDPKDPIEDLSTILRNSDVNFEIEKIERFIDSKNKSKEND